MFAAAPSSAATPLVLQTDSYFFVGGQYVKTNDGDVMDGQMYVHELVPAKVTQAFPIVMIHGNGQTGTNFEGTPDGREGWAQYFVRAGYRVYVVDQPERGRSAYHSDVDGPTPRLNFGVSALALSKLFTAPEMFNSFPQAHLHTQWPGEGPQKGQPGDPIFDQFFKSQVESTPSSTGRPERATKLAGAALLDRIGPAILLTHSQGGAFGWQIADVRPKLVKAIIAVEPSLAPSLPFNPVAAYGVTTTPITYAPPIDSPTQLEPVSQQTADGPDLAKCWTQSEPAHKLQNLVGIPIAIIVSPASVLTAQVPCVSKYLTQAGVQNDLIRLEDVGVTGNGHMMMLEKNSDQVAGVVRTWLKQAIR